MKMERTDQPMPRTGGILAVVVVYKTQPLHCSSLITLLASAAELSNQSNQAPQAPRLRILVADNTPGGQPIEALPPAVQYRAYVENPGLARPYNDALLEAERDGFEWLLTLDQDTSLPVSFLPEMLQSAKAYQQNQEVAAVVPCIVDGKRVISPFRYLGGFLPSMLPAGMSGIAGPHTSALNSASLLRVGALRELGGYDERFPLHNSDTRLYQRLDLAGKHVAVAGHVTVPHELSILDRENRMSPERYRHMLEDECFFWDRHMGPAGRAERLIRLAVRYGRGVLRGEAPAYQRLTLLELRRRLLTTRSARLARRTAAENA